MVPYPFMRDLIARLAGLAVLILMISGCASVSVDDFRLHQRGLERPEKILVAPFEFSPGALRVDRTGAELKEFEFVLQRTLSRELRDRIARHVAPTAGLQASATWPNGPYWLVTGRFVRVNQGSRLLRSTLGLGAGGTKMEAIVNVYDLRGAEPVRIMSFETTGGSNISPGIGGIVTVPVSGPMALTSLFNAFEGVRSGVTFDTQRTAREIAATLSRSFADEGWISRDKALQPKTPGEYTSPFEALFKEPAN